MWRHDRRSDPLRWRLCRPRHECPRQGGPLGEGSIETGSLRCPWHGWDFDPLTGETPGPHDDCVRTFPVEELEDGVYVGFPAEAPHERSVADVVAETLVNWGVRQVWGSSATRTSGSP
ncbi:Rieske 2Fe-2S domain-containing protein [Halorubrum sp. 48-1-W]|uniref:Rieske (2Fe-2S) protein n=1 Tax=Halorubrum sp. 48-1-W TaxID=2249761 RepID=UPI0018E5A4A3